MWPFKKAVAPTPVESEPEPKPIQFSVDDLPIHRAEKIWRAIGMGNDRFNMVPAMAAFLAMYRDWDREQCSSTRTTTDG